MYTPTTCKYTNHLRFLGPASPLGYPQDFFQDRQLVKSLSNGKTFFGEKRLRSVAEALQGFTPWHGNPGSHKNNRYFGLKKLT